MGLEQNLTLGGPGAMARGLLTGQTSPSAALYFSDACAGHLAAGRVRKLSETVFSTPSTALVIRHDARAPRAQCQRLVYFIDDLWDAAQDDSLSAFFQFKYRVVENQAANRFAPKADALVVSSDVLADRIHGLAPGRPVHVLDPCWLPSAGPAPATSAPHPDVPQAPVTIACLGSRVHGPDFQFLVPLIRIVLARVLQARFVIAGGHPLPSDLAYHPRIESWPSMTWPDYRAALAGLRAQIALYPLLDTPFNRARSRNKIYEHAQIGAAGIYPAHWPYAADVARANAGLVTAMDHGGWLSAILTLIDNPALARTLAHNARALHDPQAIAARQRALWENLLQITPAAGFMQ